MLRIYVCGNWVRREEKQMIFKLTRAAAVTVAIYVLIALNVVESSSAGKTIDPPEALVALKQAFIQR